MRSTRTRFTISVIILFIFVSIARVAVHSNPMYDFAEPALRPIEDFAASVSITSAEDGDLPSEAPPESEIRVVRRDLLGVQKNVVISFSEETSIEEGDVLTSKGVLFGVVEEVFDSRAQVKTILDPGFKATASIDDIPGIVKLEFGSLIFDRVPGFDLEGREVKADGLDGKLPVGVPLGVASEAIGEASSDVLASYVIELPFSVYETVELQKWSE